MTEEIKHLSIWVRLALILVVLTNHYFSFFFFGIGFESKVTIIVLKVTSLILFYSCGVLYWLNIGRISRMSNSRLSARVL